MCVCVCVFAQRFALTQHYQRVNGEDDDDDADDNEQLCLFHQFVFTRVMLYLCARANTLMYKFTHTHTHTSYTSIATNHNRKSWAVGSLSHDPPLSPLHDVLRDA